MQPPLVIALVQTKTSAVFLGSVLLEGEEAGGVAGPI